MMKKINIKNLRISSYGKEDAPDLDDDEYEQPNAISRGVKTLDPEHAQSSKLSCEGAGTPGTPRRSKEHGAQRKGFFKTLRRKLTTIKGPGKRDSSPHTIVDDDSSSETFPEDCSGRRRFAGKSFNYSPRTKGGRLQEEGHHGACAGPPVTERRKDLPKVPHQKPIVSSELGLPHPTKEELSKSDSSSSPTEDGKDQGAFLAEGAEYGHASAPMTSGSDTDERSRPTPSPHPPHHQSPLHSGACGHRLTLARSNSLTSVGSMPPLPPPVSPRKGLDTDPSLERRRSSLSTPHIDRQITNIQQSPYYDQVKDQVKEPMKSWSLTKELVKLSKYGWYWGPITRVEAEEKLINQPDGAFLVRDSSDERYLLSLSFRSYGRTLHTRIEHCNGVFSFYAQPESEGYSSIVDLIEHSMNDSQAGVFCYSRARTPGSPSFPVRLTKPVSRFTHVRSLQYLCRFVIREYTRFDHIQMLPLPTSIKGWLEENQY